MVDQFDELFGFMWLEVPAALVHPGRPLRIRVTGEKAGSNDWFMVFRDDLRRDVWARAEQALVRKDGRLFQIVRVEVSHLAPPGSAVISCGEAAKARLELKLGYNALEFLLPAVDREKPVTIEVALDDGSVRRGELTVKPVVPREIWLLPHSHVDIGYSDPQPVVERNHWRYFRRSDRPGREDRRATPRAPASNGTPSRPGPSRPISARPARPRRRPSSTPCAGARSDCRRRWPAS